MGHSGPLNAGLPQWTRTPDDLPPSAWGSLLAGYRHSALTPVTTRVAPAQGPLSRRPTALSKGPQKWFHLFSSQKEKKRTFRVDAYICIYTNTVLEYNFQCVLRRKAPTGEVLGPARGGAGGGEEGPELLDREDREGMFVERKRKGGKKKKK